MGLSTTLVLAWLLLVTAAGAPAISTETGPDDVKLAEALFEAQRQRIEATRAPSDGEANFIEPARTGDANPRQKGELPSP